MSVLGKAYLAVSLGLFVLGLLWASLTMQENTAWVEVVLWTPRADLLEPFERRHFEVNIAGLMAGWALAGAMVVLVAVRAPFKIRGAALAQRRARELEREVLELRTLPLRQEVEDELLAEEAHLDAPRGKVMARVVDGPKPGGARPSERSEGDT